MNGNLAQSLEIMEKRISDLCDELDTSKNELDDVKNKKKEL
jgi:hypothetical protein